MSSLTPYERLMAERIPTRPPPPPGRKPELPARPIEPWTPEEQDEHWAELCEGVGTPGAQRPPRLRLVAEEADEIETTDDDHERHSA